MATQRGAPKQQGGWLPSAPTSLSAGTGGSTANPSAEAKQDNAGTEPARDQESPPRYLTTSGLFEKPSVPSAWKESILESVPAPATEPPELVNNLRPALLQTQDKESIQPRKTWKGILALAILVAAAAAAIYLYRSRPSAAELQTAKTWMTKQWTSDLQEISSVFHPQTAGRNTRESNRRRGSGALLRGRRAANSGLPAAPASFWETPPKPHATPFVLYITDSYGRRWIITPTGEEYGPVNQLGNPPSPTPGTGSTPRKDCRSLFYPGCP